MVSRAERKKNTMQTAVGLMGLRVVSTELNCGQMKVKSFWLRATC